MDRWLRTSVVQVRLKCCERDITVKREFYCRADQSDRGLVGEGSYLIPRSDGAAIKAFEFSIGE